MANNEIFRDLKHMAGHAKLMYEELGHEAGAIGLELIAESFEEERYQDKPKGSKWARRRGDDPDKSSSDRGILRGPGGGDKLVESFTYGWDGQYVELISDKVYAVTHNEGIVMKTRAGTVYKMPQRQMMPIPGQENKLLSERILKRSDEKMDKVFLKK